MTFSLGRCAKLCFYYSSLGIFLHWDSFFTWDAADYLLRISAKSDMKLQEDLVNSNWQAEFNIDKCKLHPTRSQPLRLLG